MFARIPAGGHDMFAVRYHRGHTFGGRAFRLPVQFARQRVNAGNHFMPREDELIAAVNLKNDRRRIIRQFSPLNSPDDATRRSIKRGNGAAALVVRGNNDE